MYYREQTTPTAITNQVGYHQRGLAMALFNKCGGRLEYGLNLLRIEAANCAATMREIAALGERAAAVEARHQQIAVKPTKPTNDNQPQLPFGSTAAR